LGFAKPPVRVHIPTNLQIIITGFYALSGIVFLCKRHLRKRENPSAQNQCDKNNKKRFFPIIHNFTSENLQDSLPEILKSF